MPLFDFDKVKLLPRFRKYQIQSSLLMMLFWSTHYRKCRLCSLSLLEMTWEDFPLMFSLVCDGRCALPLLCTFYKKAVRERKSSALKREVIIFKREIPPEHTGPLGCHFCVNTVPHML